VASAWLSRSAPGRGADYSKVATAAQPTLVMKYPILQASQTFDGTQLDVPSWVN
jgi:hypothetical protein